MARRGSPTGAGDEGQGWLFGQPQPPGPAGDARRQPEPEPQPAQAPVGADQIRRLPESVRLGTSSWSFPGWRGVVYRDEHSPALLARAGLRAYAAQPWLRTVGLDRTYYAPMDAPQLADLARQVPAGFRFLVKAHQALTRPDPPGPSPRASPSVFLDAEYAAERVVLPAIEGLGAALGPIVFQFSPMDLRGAAAGLLPGGVLPAPRTNAAAARIIVDRLAEFLGSLPVGPLYGVELRSPPLLTPAYSAALAGAGACHVFNIHPTMPPISEQAAGIDPRSQPAGLVRWMLHAGEEYEGAKERYAPFNALVDEDPGSRREAAAVCRVAASLGRDAYVIVNNKAEGSAPLSVPKLIREIVEGG